MMIIGYSQGIACMMTKGGHGQTNQFHDINWDTLDHVSHLWDIHMYMYNRLHLQIARCLSTLKRKIRYSIEHLM